VTGTEKVFVEDTQPPLTVSLKDMSGRAQDRAFSWTRFAAADVTAAGLKMKRVARHACIGADQHDIDGTEL